MAGKPIHFDPDLVDVSSDPEYQARISTLGPVMTGKSLVHWAPAGKASLAKRVEMLEIDQEMNAEWEKAMEKLLQRDLTDAEFTTERMMRLRLWTRERKRRQHNLHYKYDPTRRNPRLVERDSRKQIESLRRKLEEAQARRYNKRPEVAPEGWEFSEATDAPTPRSRENRPPAPTSRPARPKPAPVEPFIPDYLDIGTINMIATDTGIRDPGRANDAEILTAYEANNQGGYVAEYFLALLRGRPLPERPEELG